jgi:hypothetical protein
VGTQFRDDVELRKDSNETEALPRLAVSRHDDRLASIVSFIDRPTQGYG